MRKVRRVDVELPCSRSEQRPEQFQHLHEIEKQKYRISDDSSRDLR
jgi:hypothetical protein